MEVEVTPLIDFSRLEYVYVIEKKTEEASEEIPFSREDLHFD
jgi:hypothetical protein